MEKRRQAWDLVWDFFLPMRHRMSGKDLRAGELFAATLLILIACSGLFALIPTGGIWRRLLIIGGLAGSSVAGLLFLRRGHIGVAAGATVLGDWAVLTFACVSGGGVYSPAFGAYLFINIIFGLIFGTRGAIIAFALTFSTGVAMLLIQQAGLIQPLADRGKPENVWLITSILQLVGTVIVIVAKRMIEQSSARAEEELAARRKIQEELHRSEAKFRSLVQNSYDVTTVHDIQGKIIYASPSTRRLLGYDPEQLIGKTPIDFIAPQELELVSKELGEVARGTNDGRPTEFHFQKSDGSYIVMESIGSNHLNDPDIQGLVINSRDITERRKAEDDLRQSERLFRDVFEHSPVGIMLVTMEGKVLRTNARLCQLLGYGEAELRTMTLYDFTHPDDCELSRNYLATVRDAEKQVSPIQKRYLAKDGSVVWAEGVATPLRNNAGTLLYFIVHVQDVGEKRKAEMALRESEERFRGLGRAAFEGIIVEEGGQVLDANIQMASLLGLELEQLIGSNLSEFIPPESLSRVRAHVQEGIEEPIEHVLQKGDGTSRTVETRGKSMPYRGKMMHVTVMRDVTIRKETEEQLRTSLKEKEVLLKEIHHRVKNNLQVVSSLLNLQRESLKDPAMKLLFGESQNRIRSMALIHEVLYRSTDLGAVPFGEYSRMLVHQLMSAYAVRDVRSNMSVQDFSMGVDQAIPCGLILNELVSNALKHAFSGERSGCVSLDIGVDGGMCSIRVSDDGVGLPKEFDLLRSPTLGMQLLMTLTKQLEGRLEFTSDPGATFTLTFPMM